MGRKAANISIKELEAIVEKNFEEDEYASIKRLTPKIEDDLKKVEFDDENYEFRDDSPGYPYSGLLSYQRIGDLTFLGCQAGGDWEYPVFFIIYYDGKQLRAYIPSKGNCWNRKTKSAYGNNDDDPDQDEVPDFTEPDIELIKKDILERITVA
jgi:hypothetical protein